MRSITRRDFLKTSAAAVGSSALTQPIIAKAKENLQNGENPKIYAVFAGSGPGHNETSVTPTSNREILHRLQQECKVDFISRDFSTDVVNELKNLKKMRFDGVLVVGDLRNYSFLETGLPTIYVYDLPGFMGAPYALFPDHKVLSAQLDRLKLSSSPSVSVAMFQDLVEKVKLFAVLKKMKEARILLATNHRYINEYRGDTRKTYPPGYNESITKALDRSLGTKVTKIGISEVAEDKEIKDIWYNDNKEAEQIAKMWIRRAKEMKDTLESEVVKSAKMYLAFKALLRKYNATAIAYALRSLVKQPRAIDTVFPSLGNSELQKQGIVGCCQGHLNVVLTHMLGQYAFGKPSMMGDFQIDTFNNVTWLMHCGAPHNPHGGNEIAPYVIRDHAERPVRSHATPGCGACSEVVYPAGEPVTIWRIDLLSKMILVHTGTTVSHSIYKDFYEYIGCRTKLLVKVDDAEKIQRHFYADKTGKHRSGILGDYRKEIKDLATLIGFEVMEEDR